MSTAINFNQYSLADWLEYLASPSRYRIELGLTRVRAVAIAAQLLDWHCPVITIAGTNGKGSTTALLETCYVAQGYRVGCYTSPHLIQFNERVRINAQPVSDSRLCEAFSALLMLHPEAHELTYFEFLTLAALSIFKQSSLDVLILEVGLGGRLDATNVVDADLAIVTSIDIDHCDYLGTSKEQIAFEKSGIFRSSQLALCGEAMPPRALHTQAAKQGAHFEYLGRDYHFTAQAEDWSFSNRIIEYTELPQPSLLLDNAALALHAMSRFSRCLPIDEASVRTGLTTVYLPGRCQWLAGTVNHIIDVAHNPHSCRNLAQFIRRKSVAMKVHAVMGMFKDKDIAGSIEALVPLIDVWHVAAIDYPRSASAAYMAQILRENQASVVEYSDLKTAYSMALTQMKAGECLLIFGSFMTVAELAKADVINLNEVSADGE